MDRPSVISHMISLQFPCQSIERTKLTDDYGTEDNKRDDYLQGGCQELFLILRRVMWDFQLGKGERRDKYCPNTHLEDQSVNMSPDHTDAEGENSLPLTGPVTRSAYRQ